MIRKKTLKMQNTATNLVKSHIGTPEELAEIDKLIADKIRLRHGFVDDGSPYNGRKGPQKWQRVAVPAEGQKRW